MTVLRWVVFFPVAFLAMTIVGFSLAWVVGGIRGPTAAHDFRHRLADTLEIGVFFVMGVTFVAAGALVAPAYHGAVAAGLAVVRTGVALQPVGKFGCRVTVVLGVWAAAVWFLIA